MDLHLVWFVILAVLLTGYAILDGIDFGVGILHIFSRTDKDRRIHLNSIGPIWDGNEVWLVTFGGALFAAFPHAYATVFSAYYLPFMAVLWCLIFRAVSIEFRSKHDAKLWRNFWDTAFCLSSTLAAFLFGGAAGNMFLGMPIGPDMEFKGVFFDLWHPYPVLTGLFAVAVCAMHGSIYLYLKTEGEMQKRIHGWMWHTFGLFVVFYMLTTICTLVTIPSATRHFASMPWAWVVVVLNVLAVANIPRAIYLGKPAYAFLSSCATIAALTFLFGMAMFPNLVVSSLKPEWSLNIYNAASSDQTLWIMFVIALIGMPFVATYTTVVYWVFRGKVQLGKHSY